MADVPLRIGALACSDIARRQILPVLRDDDRFDLRGVASRSADKAAAFADEFGTRGCSYEELLADPEIEAVYVSTPVGLHARWGTAVVEAGKHLLVEKTATHDLASARALMAAGRDRGSVVMEALAYVFHPLVRRLGQVVAEGRLGALRHVEATFTVPAREADDIRMDAGLGGGAFLDLAVYPISFCLLAVGAVPERAALIPARDEAAGVDVRGACQLGWRDCSAHVSYGFGLSYRNEVRLQGETGHLGVERVFTRPADMAAPIELACAGGPQTVAVEAANAYARMLAHFAARVRGDVQAGPNEGADLRQRMEFLETLRPSVR